MTLRVPAPDWEAISIALPARSCPQPAQDAPLPPRDGRPDARHLPRRPVLEDGDLRLEVRVRSFIRSSRASIASNRPHVFAELDERGMQRLHVWRHVSGERGLRCLTCGRATSLVPPSRNPSRVRGAETPWPPDQHRVKQATMAHSASIEGSSSS
jgi:hypothetical protein